MKEYVLTFDIEDKVAYKNRIGKDEGIIVGIYIRKGLIMYDVIWSNKSTITHYDYELQLIS